MFPLFVRYSHNQLLKEKSSFSMISRTQQTLNDIHYEGGKIEGKTTVKCLMNKENHSVNLEQLKLEIKIVSLEWKPTVLLSIEDGKIGSPKVLGLCLQPICQRTSF